MANILPTDAISGIASDGTNLTIPIASLVGLTSAQADPATGDGRELIRSICETIAQNIQALDPANRPTEMTFQKGNGNFQNGQQNTVREVFTVNFDVTYDPSNVTLTPEA